MERLRMAMRGKLVVIAAAMALGLMVWRVDAIRAGAGLTDGSRGLTLVQPDPAADRQGMFNAVKAMLESAHVPSQDMPRRIIAVTPVGRGHFHVHMEMVQGDGWFDLTWDGKAWQVRGMNSPQ